MKRTLECVNPRCGVYAEFDDPDAETWGCWCCGAPLRVKRQERVA